MDGMFLYPPLEEVLSEAGLQEVETYVSCRKNKVAQCIDTRPIMYLFLVSERRLGTRVSKRWCEQEGLDLVVILTEVWEI